MFYVGHGVLESMNRLLIFHHHLGLDRNRPAGLPDYDFRSAGHRTKVPECNDLDFSFTC